MRRLIQEESDSSCAHCGYKPRPREVLQKVSKTDMSLTNHFTPRPKAFVVRLLAIRNRRFIWTARFWPPTVQPGYILHQAVSTGFSLLLRSGLARSIAISSRPPILVVRPYILRRRYRVVEKWGRFHKLTVVQ